MTMLSRIPVRWMTNASPSNARRKAATVPRRLEPNIRRATRPMMRIDSVPSRATENRHPKEELTPNSHSPTAMTHLPTGGWTTMSPLVELKTLVVPWVNSLSGLRRLELTLISTP